jgi:chemotaxis protein CheX
MSLHDILANCISQSCIQVFSTMLGVTLEPPEVSVETSTPNANDGVVSLIGLAGTWTGTGSIGCSPALACRICALMLMTEVQAVNEEVLDAVAELTNMIVGSVKTDLEQHLGPLGLSIPTVVYGRNFKMRSTRTSEWTTLHFTWEGEPLLVRLSLAPTQEAGHPRMHIPAHACDVEM